ncbi:MAG: methyltransferase domain-containing protein [Dehalococcoidia bacterium]|nr:methyltransferase domain-containing protein [Dehalococcoidia bacterium]
MSSPPRPRHRFFAAGYDIGARIADVRLAPLRHLVAGEAEGRVLEIGAGTGANFDYYRWARIEALEATEPDPFMLRRAEARARKLPPYVRERLTLTQAPAEALPFPDASFDAVVATLVLCTVADLDAAIAETFRVLKPGGAFRLLEHVAARGFEAKAQRFVQPVYGWLAAGCHLNRDTASALRQAGFRVEILRRERFGPLAPAMVATATKES